MDVYMYIPYYIEQIEQNVSDLIVIPTLLCNLYGPLKKPKYEYNSYPEQLHV